MLTQIFTGLLLIQAQPSSSETGTVSRPALDIPDEIAPAATFYFACKTASQGIPFRQGRDGPIFNPDNIQTGDDCSEIRNREMERAMQMLSGSSMSKKKRREFVKQTFDEIDAVANFQPGPAPGGKE